MLNDRTPYERVVVGKAVEREIIEFLRTKGLHISPSSVGEDEHGKIDGWLVWNGEKEPIQIKFREGGNDVIFEILRDIDKMLVGRDMESKATIYIVMDTYSTIRMFRVDDLKSHAKVLQKYVLDEHKIFPKKVNWGRREQCSVKITIDKANGKRKLMAYFNPTMLTVLGTWQK